MAATKAKKPAVAKDFQDIIQGDRQRRKHEALASKIFGKGRRASAPGAASASRKAGPASLADRIQAPRRSLSTTLNPTTFKKTAARPQGQRRPTGDVNAEWTHDLHDSTASRPAGRQAKANGAAIRNNTRGLSNTALSNVLDSQANIIKPAKTSTGMSIRGLAGPYTVIAENFAPGTTAADIQSAMTPVGGSILKCVMTASNPVTAEITFENKEGAENVIAQFHGQTADGLLLSLYHKIAASVPTKAPAEAPAGPRNSAPRPDNRPQRRFNGDHYEPSDRNRDRGRLNARDEVQDGNYGFDDKMDVDGAENGGRSGGLYSDTMVGGRSYDDRARPRGGNNRDTGRNGNDRGPRGYR